MATKKTIAGFLFNGETLFPQHLEVIFTSDMHGETLSICAQDEFMLTVPFEEVERLIKQTRENNHAE